MSQTAQNLLFIQALIVYIDRLQELLGRTWPTFQSQLQQGLVDLADARDEAQVSRLVNEIFEFGLNSLAAELFRSLFSQSSEQANRVNSLTRSVSMFDPTSGQSREIELLPSSGVVAKGLFIDHAVVIAAGQVLAQTLQEREALTFSKSAAPPNDYAFSAYPALEAPDEVTPLTEFTVTVGFRADLDPELLEVQPVYIENPPPDASFLVILMGDGVEILNGHHRQLPLKLDATVTFTCHTKPNISEAILTVDYIYNSQVVGMAKRRVRVVVGIRTPRPPQSTTQPHPCQMSLPSPDSRVDLTVNIAHAGPDQLQWVFIAPQPQIEYGPILTNLVGAREFSADLLAELKTQNHTGPFAANILENRGQTIADKMPAAFFEILQQVYQSVGRLPTLLLRTEETYVPWELAVLPEPLDPALPPFLATQTYVGRWIRHERVVSPPPLLIELQRFTVVASKYGQGSGQRELLEALKEREELLAFFKHLCPASQALEATQNDLVRLIRGDKSPGHLIHFAVHGMSDPEANDQALLLADRMRLPPSALTGSYHCGQVPNFTFIFLNACQVGTSGSSLGQAAGFPGILLQGGALGFIAPLWEVHDEPARTLAEAFYSALLEQQQNVAEFLHRQRLSYDGQGSTTPMAYIYYGHPTLQMRILNKEN